MITTEITKEMTTATETPETPETKKTRTLALKREVIRSLGDRLLTTQGWSLWTCDEPDTGESGEVK